MHPTPLEAIFSFLLEASLLSPLFTNGSMNDFLSPETPENPTEQMPESPARRLNQKRCISQVSLAGPSLKENMLLNAVDVTTPPPNVPTYGHSPTYELTGNPYSGTKTMGNLCPSFKTLYFAPRSPPSLTRVFRTLVCWTELSQNSLLATSLLTQLDSSSPGEPWSLFPTRRHWFLPGGRIFLISRS
jgi:hypothetical protein